MTRIFTLDQNLKATVKWFIVKVEGWNLPVGFAGGSKA
jgi:hypothetical protein